MNKVLKSCKEFFYPVLSCPVCMEFSEGLCLKCENQLTFYETTSLTESVEGISLYSYNQTANDLISSYKNKKKFSAGEAMLKLMLKKTGIEMNKMQIITCAPSSNKSIKRLGFDHGAYLIKMISKDIDVPYALLFEPSKEIQKGLTKEERAVNVLGIELKKGAIEICRGKSVLIIDDVFTTGSTVKRCLFLLKQEGINAKYMTFSRV